MHLSTATRACACASMAQCSELPCPAAAHWVLANDPAALPPTSERQSHHTATHPLQPTNTHTHTHTHTCPHPFIWSKTCLRSCNEKAFVKDTNARSVGSLPAGGVGTGPSVPVSAINKPSHPSAMQCSPERPSFPWGNTNIPSKLLRAPTKPTHPRDQKPPATAGMSTKRALAAANVHTCAAALALSLHALRILKAICVGQQCFDCKLVFVIACFGATKPTAHEAKNPV